MNRLFGFFLLLLAIAANAQTVRWTSYMETPLITQDKTVTNDTTVEKLLTISLPPGKTVKVEYSVVLVPLVIDVTQAAEQSGTYVSNGVLGGVDKADWLKYSVALTDKYEKIVYRYAMDKEGTPGTVISGGVEFRTGSITGPVFASAQLPVTGGWAAYVELEITITTPVNASEIFVTFQNSQRTTGSGGNIQWFEFR